MSNTQSAHFLSSNRPFNDSMVSVWDVKAIPLALYIHIPWCVKKCPYCDFNSHELPEDSQLSMYDEYVDALLLDARLQQSLTQEREISSIFIGGGTPSLLPIAQYQRLFSGLRRIFSFAEDIEVTMEANPGTLEHAPFSEYLKVGINRLSIGVQSFAADKLKTLGRIHDPAQALSAIRAARTAGFERVNVDLMHGLPQQMMDEALTDIRMAHEAGATHISWYQLTIEQNTEFYSAPPTLPVDDTLADIQEHGHVLLQQAGFHQYEVSAYAKPHKHSRHNFNYWRFGDYIGIGAGAHGKLTQFNPSGKLQLERRNKARQPQHYLNYQQRITGFVAGSEQLTAEQLPLEFVMNALRLNEGVDITVFQQTTGLSVTALEPQRQHLIGRGLLESDPQRLQTTSLGRRFLNEVLAVYMK